MGRSPAAVLEWGLDHHGVGGGDEVVGHRVFRGVLGCGDGVALPPQTSDHPTYTSCPPSAACGDGALTTRSTPTTASSMTCEPTYRTPSTVNAASGCWR